MSERDAWSPYEHLGYLYAAVASSGDRTISEDELEVMAQKLYEWNTDMEVADLLKIVVETSHAFSEDAKLKGWHERVMASAEFLRDGLGGEGRAAAIQDLVAIAEADGTVLPDEQQMLHVICRAWGLEGPSSTANGVAESPGVDLSGLEVEDPGDAEDEADDQPVTEVDGGEEPDAPFLDSETQPPYPGEFWGPTDRWSTTPLIISRLPRPKDPDVLLRRFSPQEVETIVAAIEATGKLPRLTFFHEAFEDVLEHEHRKPPFWFIPFTAYGNNRGCLFVFEENGFFGNFNDPGTLTPGANADYIDELDVDEGNAGPDYWASDPDESIVTTMVIHYTNEQGKNALDVVERHGEGFGSQLRIVEAIWQIWAGVVEKSRGASAWAYDPVFDCVSLNSWDDVLAWARSDEDDATDEGSADDYVDDGAGDDWVPTQSAEPTDDPGEWGASQHFVYLHASVLLTIGTVIDEQMLSRMTNTFSFGTEWGRDNANAVTNAVIERLKRDRTDAETADEQFAASARAVLEESEGWLGTALDELIEDSQDENGLSATADRVLTQLKTIWNLSTPLPAPGEAYPTVGRGESEIWIPLLSYIYASVVSSDFAPIGEGEIQAISDQIAGWLGPSDLDLGDEYIRPAVARLEKDQQDSEQWEAAFTAAVEELRHLAAVPSHYRRLLAFEAMVELAEADGPIDATEQAMLSVARELWGICEPIPESDDRKPENDEVEQPDVAEATDRADPGSESAALIAGLEELVSRVEDPVAGAVFVAGLPGAAADGDLDEVTRFLAQGEDVDFRLNDGSTALQRAAWDGHTAVVDKLLEAGADVNAQDNEGYTALHYACTDGQIEVVELLLASGADITLRMTGEHPCYGANGQTALRHAVINMRWPCIVALLNAGATVAELHEPCADGRSFFDAMRSLADDFPAIADAYRASRQKLGKLEENEATTSAELAALLTEEISGDSPASAGSDTEAVLTSSEPSGTLSADWTSIVEDCAWPLAHEVAVRCYEEKPVEPGSSKRFSGVRKHYRDCDWINVIFRQKYLSLYIKGEERDWEGLFDAIGVQPEIRRWRDGVQVRCRTSEEVLAAMNWLELPL